MEPITLCGAVILMFGLWVEFEAELRAVKKMICTSKLFKAATSHSTGRRPAYVRRMPVNAVRT